MKQCIVCKSRERFAFTKHGYEIRVCPKCKLFRTALEKPYLQMIKGYYTKGYFTGSNSKAGYANYEQDHQVIRNNAKAYLRIIKDRQPTGKILDVGCATGIFLDEAEKAGYQGYGIDVSNFAISQAKKRFHNRVKLGTLTQRSFSPQSFNIISFLDVFEHLNNPGNQLQICHQLLKPGGIIIINTGNTQSIMARLQHNSWHFFIPPQHVYFYSKKNLCILLGSVGFNILSVNKLGKHISLRYLLHLMRTINKSGIANWLFNQVSHNHLGKIPLYINLYDNITIIARKNISLNLYQ